MTDATRPLVAEIIDNCHGASASAGEAGGVARDIDTGVERLEAEAEGTTASVTTVTGDVDHLSGNLDALRTESGAHWDQALAQVEKIRSRSRDVSVANRQAQTAATRAQSDIAAIVSVAERLAARDASKIDLRGESRGEPPLLDRIRQARTLRVGVWHGRRSSG